MVIYRRVPLSIRNKPGQTTVGGDAGREKTLEEPVPEPLPGFPLHLVIR